MTDFDFSKYKVLLCDTDPKVIDTARNTFIDAGIGDFVATPSHKEAIRYIPEMKPDLILVSMMFDDVNGISVIQKIRSLNDGEFYKTPILIILERASQNLLREACRVGIEGALRKPLAAEKVLRFSRAVILKPRRFICVRHYFGPERRMRSDPHFGGEDRRNGFTKEELSTDAYTRKAPSVTIATDNSPSVRAGVTMSGSTNSSSPPASSGNWGASQSKPAQSGGVMEFSSGATGGNASASQGEYDLIGGANTSDQASNADFDFTSDDKASSNGGDFDFGISKERPSDQNADYDFTSEDKGTPEAGDIEAAPSEKQKKAQPAVQETGPDDDDFEEIMDLEECLELHKLWVNSGGKGGQQAKRPHSDFRGKELAEADFTRAILPQSNFEDVNCTSTVFRKADLSGSTFKGALLSSADMRVSRLNKADLRNARMDKANFLGADLSGANLEGATLRSVNLSGANLHLTNLRGVNLSSAQGLIPEQIKRAITDQTTRLPLSARTST